MIEWSTRLDGLSEELARLERQTTADEIHVKTYEDHTKVELRFEHEEKDE